MKTRESGMPEEGLWNSFLRPREALTALGLKTGSRLVIEFGSGYGTFSLEAARMIDGRVLGFDIETDLVDLCRRKAVKAGLGNARFEVRDFVADGTGLADGAADFVMLFNILHAEESDTLLREARRILAPDGILAVMHWKYDRQTPRGPSMDIRPRPEDCCRRVRFAGFAKTGPLIDLPPWHYGFTAEPSRGRRIQG